MKPPIIFSTHSEHKLREVNQLLGAPWSFLSLKDLNFTEDIPEPFFTLEENAQAKAETIFQRFHKKTFAEDTGLFIDALNGEPGVLSARYAGEPSNATKNIEKVLQLLGDTEYRNAHFKTVICFKTSEEIYFFEGICEGRITTDIRGEKGFGYDPVFIPEGYNKTFAELGDEEKNKMSHRKKAFDEFKEFLLVNL